MHIRRAVAMPDAAFETAEALRKKMDGTAFAGADPGKNESGKHVPKSVRTTKKESPNLRRTLFRVMDGLVRHPSR